MAKYSIIALASFLLHIAAGDATSEMITLDLGHVQHLATTDEHRRHLSLFQSDVNGARSSMSRHEFVRRYLNQEYGDDRDDSDFYDEAEKYALNSSSSLRNGRRTAGQGEEDTVTGDGTVEVSPLWQGLGTHYGTCIRWIRIRVNFYWFCSLFINFFRICSDCLGGNSSSAQVRHC